MFPPEASLVGGSSILNSVLSFTVISVLLAIVSTPFVVLVPGIGFSGTIPRSYNAEIENVSPFESTFCSPPVINMFEKRLFGLVAVYTPSSPKQITAIASIANVLPILNTLF